jgi:hypothetical protein
MIFAVGMAGLAAKTWEAVLGGEIHEYTLFGKAMKFAGIYGKEIRVIGKNRETLTAKAALVQ